MSLLLDFHEKWYKQTFLVRKNDMRRLKPENFYQHKILFIQQINFCAEQAQNFTFSKVLLFPTFFRRSDDDRPFSIIIFQENLLICR
jgi:hypothetical protein